jgi:branched-chain amino acid transport system ATP-binding protein
VPVTNPPAPAAASGTAPALALVGVGRRFGALVALDGVHLTLPPGERRAIIGANGAGKTTLFNTIAGDVAPTAGDIHLFGEKVTGLPPHARTRRGLRRTYQSSQLLDGLTVYENLYVAVRGVRAGRFSLWRSAAGGNDDAEVVAIARRTGVEALFARRARDLSHGERRQVDIAMSLAGRPRVLLLDEPAAGLAPGERERLLGLLEALPADLTVVLIEHDMDIALRFAQRVTVMHRGRIVCEDTPEAIADNPQVHEIYIGRRHA